jgi:hypothetical protein
MADPLSQDKCIFFSKFVLAIQVILFLLMVDTPLSTKKSRSQEMCEGEWELYFSNPWFGLPTMHALRLAAVRGGGTAESPVPLCHNFDQVGRFYENISNILRTHVHRHLENRN